jgi:hypothetical protein
VARWEQFEVWALSGEKWEMIAAFLDFQVANAMARNHASRVRLIHAVYEDGKAVEKEILAEVGSTREHP